MKTGGNTLEQRTAVNFGTNECYPHAMAEGERLTAKLSVQFFAELTPEQRAAFRFYSVHMPFCASELAGPNLVRITILRDPIARVVSAIKHVKRNVRGCEGRSLAEIYEVPWLFHGFFDNTQVKTFATRLDDRHLEHADDIRKLGESGPPLDSTFTDRVNEIFLAKRDEHVFELDEARMALAKANLVRVDALGLTDRLDELLATLESEYGLRTTHSPPVNVGHDEPVSDTLLAKIARDNRFDIEFYEYARQLYERRRSALRA